MKNVDQRIIDRVQEHYDIVKSSGYEIFAIFLRGSQNYQLDNEESDVDTVAVIFPNIEDIINAKSPVSTTKIIENDEHIEIKDIREFFNLLLKQNPSYLECLCTDYFKTTDEYLEDVNKLRANANDIAHITPSSFLAAACGISYSFVEKLRATPTNKTSDTICRKSLSNVMRLSSQVKQYVEGKSFAQCLIPEDLEFVRDIKFGDYPITSDSTILMLAESYDRIARELASYHVINIDKNIKSGDKISEFLMSLKCNIIKKYLKKAII